MISMPTSPSACPASRSGWNRAWSLSVSAASVATSSPSCSPQSPCSRSTASCTSVAASGRQAPSRLGMQRRGHCLEERFPRLRGDPVGHCQERRGYLGILPQESLAQRRCRSSCSAERHTCRGREIRATEPAPPQAVVPWPGISSISGRHATAAMLRGRSAAPGKPICLLRVARGAARRDRQAPPSAPGLRLRSICSTTRSTNFRVALGAQQERRGVGGDRGRRRIGSWRVPRGRLCGPASSTADRATLAVMDSARVAFAAVTRSLPTCVPASSARLARAICAAVVSGTRPAAVSGTRTACAASRVAHGTCRSCASSTSSMVVASEMTSGPSDAVRTSHSTSA